MPLGGVLIVTDGCLLWLCSEINQPAGYKRKRSKKRKDGDGNGDDSSDDDRRPVLQWREDMTVRLLLSCQQCSAVQAASRWLTGLYRLLARQIDELQQWHREQNEMQQRKRAAAAEIAAMVESAAVAAGPSADDGRRRGASAASTASREEPSAKRAKAAVDGGGRSRVRSHACLVHGLSVPPTV